MDPIGDILCDTVPDIVLRGYGTAASDVYGVLLKTTGGYVIVRRRTPKATRWRIAWNSGPVRARVLIHSGLRSMGTLALRASMRSSRRPSGAVTSQSLRGGRGWRRRQISDR